MTGGAGPHQYTSHSRILGCMPLNCVSQCTIDSFVRRSQSCGPRRVAFQQAFNPPPTCFAVSFFLASPQVSASKTTLTETNLLEVCPAKVRPHYFVFHQHFSWRPGHHLSESLHSNFGCRTHCHCHLVTKEWPAFRVFYQRLLFPTRGLMFTDLV